MLICIVCELFHPQYPESPISEDQQILITTQFLSGPKQDSIWWPPQNIPTKNKKIYIFDRLLLPSRKQRPALAVQSSVFAMNIETHKTGRLGFTPSCLFIDKDYHLGGLNKNKFIIAQMKHLYLYNTRVDR